MLTIQYIGQYPCPFLAPLACVYMFHDQLEFRSLAYNDIQVLDDFVENEKQADYYIPITNTCIRVEECDACEEVENRYAFTGLCLMNIPEPTSNVMFWKVMKHSMSVIRWMKQKHMDPAMIAFLERVLWTSLHTERKAYVSKITGNFLQQWSAKAAEKYYAPDYLWTTGTRCGSTTMEWMTKKWEQKVL